MIKQNNMRNSTMQLMTMTQLIQNMITQLTNNSQQPQNPHENSSKSDISNDK